MLLSSLLLSFAGLATAWSSSLPSREAETTPNYVPFTNVTVFKAPADWPDHFVMYGRIVLLNQNCEKDNVILSTWSLKAPNKTYLPIYRSTDLGRTWKPLSKVYFNRPGYTTIAQPFLYETAQRFGKYPAGTVLVAGNSWNGTGEDLELHASLDKGETWEYVTTVVKGGPPNTDDGGTSVWEPFIMAHDNKLGYFYSDSRDPLHSQKLSHQTTTDLKNWDPPVNDARNPDYHIRPGMTSITEMGNGKFLFAYEVNGVPGFPSYAQQPIFYRIADSPFEFDTAEEFPLIASTPGNETASSAPQVIWTPAGGENGTIVLTGSHGESFFTNTAYGDPKEWKSVHSGLGVGYSRQPVIVPGTEGKVLLVIDGGPWSTTNVDNKVTAGNFIVAGPGSKKDAPGYTNCEKV